MIMTTIVNGISVEAVGTGVNGFEPYIVQRCRHKGAEFISNFVSEKDADDWIKKHGEKERTIIKGPVAPMTSKGCYLEEGKEALKNNSIALYVR